jgi:hypothetical protein
MVLIRPGGHRSVNRQAGDVPVDQPPANEVKMPLSEDSFGHLLWMMKHF